MHGGIRRQVVGPVVRVEPISATSSTLTSTFQQQSGLVLRPDEPKVPEPDRVLARPDLVTPALARAQPPGLVERLGDLRLDEQLGGLDVDHQQAGGGVQQEVGDALAQVLPLRPETQNGWLAIPRTEGSKSASHTRSRSSRLSSDQGAGRGGLQPAGIVPLSLVHGNATSTDP